MKKNGFTLSEVLVVLGIIGVVSALTLPSLMSDTLASQIGPKLAKAVSTFDQANAGLLNEAIADNLLDTGLLDNGGSDYFDKLTNHLKAARGGEVGNAGAKAACDGLEGDLIGAVTAKDGTVYEIYYNKNATQGGGPAHKDKIGYVTVDINGSSSPNEAGQDVFAFTWWADGSLQPAGGSNSGSGCTWNGANKHCMGKVDGTDKGVQNYWACAGHIFENSFKVKYE